ncbi:MAG: TetR/AcrR family transcriptional regulator [Chloroflexi bacterium]|nr:TetR/AcrR family transcriptional regulator [Chloroflexota bacterium]
MVQRLTPTERRQRNREEMIQAILDVSREVMREDGVAALNLNEVARRLKMKTPSLYKYFSGKSAVYDELFRLAHHIFLEQVESRLARQTGSFWDVWTAVLEAQLEFAHAYPELFELGFQRPVPGFTPSEESMAMSQHSADRGEELIHRAIESGEIVTELTLAQVRDLFFVVTAGLTAAQIANEPDVPPEQGRFGSLARHAIEVFRSAWGSDGRKSNTRQTLKGGR